MPDLLSTARRARLFHRVPTALVESALSASRTETLAAGDRLLQAGQENAALYVVMSGSLEVRLPPPSSPVRVGEGECVGVRSVIDQSGVAGDVVATDATTVIRIDRTDLWTLINSSAEAARNLLVMLAGRIRQRDGSITGAGRLMPGDDHAIDELTGLHNRAWLDDAFRRQITRTTEAHEPVALLMVDIDRFAHITDVHGPLIGDAVIRRTSRLLASGLRPQDLLARYDHQRFAVLLPGAEAAAATSIGERLRQAVSVVPPERLDERLPPASVSIGVAVAREAVPLEALVDLAAGALQRAQQAGRDRVSV